MSIGQHTLVQDARNHNPTPLLAIKHDVLATLQAAQPRANVLTESA